ncbi:MAG: hypothetical protein NVS4B11_38830 [Ktedonobacteraceae bacterium]
MYTIASAILSSDFTIQENRETLARAEAGELKLLLRRSQNRFHESS